MCPGGALFMHLELIDAPNTVLRFASLHMSLQILSFKWRFLEWGTGKNTNRRQIYHAKKYLDER